MSALGYAHGATLIAGAVHATSQRARSHRSARQNRRRAPHFTAREPTIRWLSQRRHGTGRDDARQAASIGGVGFSIDGFWGKKEKRTDAGDGAGDGKGDGKGDAGGDGGGDGEGGFIHAGVRRYVKVMTASPRRRRVAV